MKPTWQHQRNSWSSSWTWSSRLRRRVHGGSGSDGNVGSLLHVILFFCVVHHELGLLPATSTMSPGTMSRALILCTLFLSWRYTFPISGSYSFRASMAFSAFRSWREEFLEVRYSTNQNQTWHQWVRQEVSNGDSGTSQTSVTWCPLYLFPVTWFNCSLCDWTVHSWSHRGPWRTAGRSGPHNTSTTYLLHFPLCPHESHDYDQWAGADEPLTCQTPTMAFAMRISRMTKGSTKAVMVSSPSSNQARTCTKHEKKKWMNEWRKKGGH